MISKVKIKSVLVKAFGAGETSRDGVNFAICCPKCNDSRKSKKKLIVRLDDGRFHCWVCGFKGRKISSLFRQFKPEFLSEVSDFKESKAIEVENVVSLPKNAVLLAEYKGRDPDINRSKQYLYSRGLNDSDISRWRIMASSRGQYRRRVIIPSFDSLGNLNYYVARAIDEESKPKYLNSKAKKKEIIFNEIDINWSKPIILVEGVFDAIKSPYNTIPILGSYVSKNSLLFNQIVVNQCKVFLSLDPDMKDKAYGIASNLSKAGCEVSVSFASNGLDLGDMKKKEVLNLIRSSVGYTREHNIFHRISKIKSGSIF